MVVPRVRTRSNAPVSCDTGHEYCAGLSVIQWKVLDLMRRGLTIEAIAKELGLARGTVELHIRYSLRKLHARNRKELLSRIAPCH